MISSSEQLRSVLAEATLVTGSSLDRQGFDGVSQA